MNIVVEHKLNLFRYNTRSETRLVLQEEGESFREFLVKCWGKLNFYCVSYGVLYDDNDDLIGEIRYRKREFRDMRYKKFKSFTIKIKEGLLYEKS